MADLRLQFHAQTDIGCVRANNEDNVVFDARNNLAILADGMGGHQAGEVASQMACTLILTSLKKCLQGAHVSCRHDVKQVILQSAQLANQVILRAARKHAHLAGMGTTVVICALHGRHLVLGHAGDSRAYLYRLGQLNQMTRDHSLMQEQIDAGLICPGQANIMNKNIITRALGIQKHNPLEVQEIFLQAHDVVLLCSDGLSDMLDDACMRLHLQAQKDLALMGHNLIAAAKQAGGLDNIALILMRALAPPGSDADCASACGKLP